MKQLENVLKENGVPWENPLLTLDTLTGCAIPHLRITHRGYVRMKDRQDLSCEA
jgi:adenine deaminase